MNPISSLISTFNPHNLIAGGGQQSHPVQSSTGARTAYSMMESVDIRVSAEGRRLSYQYRAEIRFDSGPLINIAPVETTHSGQSPQTSARNILNLIHSHLNRLASANRSPDELQAAADMEYTAYQKGRDEAIAILESLGVFDEATRIEIGKTSELVLRGIEEFKQKFAPAEVTPSLNAGAAQSDVVRTGTSPSTDNNDKPAIILKSAFAEEVVSARQKRNDQVTYVRERLTNKQTINLQIRTNDGDVITLMLGNVEDLQTQRGNLPGWHTLNLQRATAFDVVVDGTLDKGEVEALEKLIDQVSKLASVFWSGDDANSFELARNLNLDASELMSMSLNITHIQQFTGSYETVHAGSSEGDAGYRQSPFDLGRYMSSLKNALETASRFSQPKELVGDLFSVAMMRLQLTSTVELSEFSLRFRDIYQTSREYKQPYATDYSGGG